MEWSERFKKEQEPDLEQVAEYIGSPLWRELCGFLETNYEIRRKSNTARAPPPDGISSTKNGGAVHLYPNRAFSLLICIGEGKKWKRAVLTLAPLYANFTKIQADERDPLADARHHVGGRFGGRKTPAFRPGEAEGKTGVTV